MRFSKLVKLYHYLNRGKLRKFDSYLKLIPRHVLFFLFVYSTLLLIINLLFTLAVQIPSERFEFLKRFPLSFSFSLTPCAIAKTNTFSLHKDIICTPDYGVILLYIYFAAVSFLLVFSRKLKFGHWIIGFIFFNLLAGVFLVLKDYLYLNL